jgi:hypothetical protein
MAQDWEHPIPELIGAALSHDVWLQLLVPYYAQVLERLKPWRDDPWLEGQWAAARDRFDEYARNAPTPAALNEAWRELVIAAARIILQVQAQRQREAKLRRRA